MIWMHDKVQDNKDMRYWDIRLLGHQVIKIYNKQILL